MSEKLKRLWATKNKDDEWWSSFVTAPLAIAINYVVVDIKWLTPNLITLFSFITALASVVFIIIGGFINFIIAAVLIHLSHILDCMDGQMARYRGIVSKAGSYIDKITDQIQITLWFGALGYAAYVQTQNVTAAFLALIGISFYSLRGYSKYVTLYSIRNESINSYKKNLNTKTIAGIEHSAGENLSWFINEQLKILQFNEGVFIFLISFALLFNMILPVLWIFASSQLFYGLFRSLTYGYKLYHTQHITIKK